MKLDHTFRKNNSKMTKNGIKNENNDVTHLLRPDHVHAAALEILVAGSHTFDQVFRLGKVYVDSSVAGMGIYCVLSSSPDRIHFLVHN